MHEYTMLNKYLKANEDKAISLEFFEKSIIAELILIKVVVSELKEFAIKYKGNSFDEDIDGKLGVLIVIFKDLRKQAEYYDGICFTDELDSHLDSLMTVKTKDDSECENLNELQNWLKDLI